MLELTSFKSVFSILSKILTKIKKSFIRLNYIIFPSCPLFLFLRI